MNYLQALKTTRDYFGMDAMAVLGEDIFAVSELIEQDETSPMASGSANAEVRLQTGGSITTATGTQIPAWAIFEATEAGQPNATDEEKEPLLLVVSGKDLPG